MNSNMKYIRPINTIGYLSVTKKKDNYKNNLTKNNYQHNYPGHLGRKIVMLGGLQGSM